MNKQEIHAYLREKGLDPKIRLPLPNGGQYLGELPTPKGSGLQGSTLQLMLATRLDF
jgi:hypothetical protein